MKEFKEIETTKENLETKMNMKETSKKAAKKVKTWLLELSLEQLVELIFTIQ